MKEQKFFLGNTLIVILFLGFIAAYFFLIPPWAIVPQLREGRISPIGYSLVAEIKEHLSETINAKDQAILAAKEWIYRGKEPKEIETLMLLQFPLVQRLLNEKTPPYLLPLAKPKDQWAPLSSFKLKAFNRETTDFEPVKNFTIYSNIDFIRLQNAYLDLQNSFSQKSPLLEEKIKKLGELLLKAYENSNRKSAENFSYPSKRQLKTELFYANFPFALGILIFYAAALLFYIFSKINPRHVFLLIGNSCLFFGFFLQTLLFVCRIYILERPPVSNMEESLVYVPWIAIIPGIIFNNLSLRISSVLLGVVFSSIWFFNGTIEPLKTLQPVLNSSYWLIIHVLMIVASYALFLLSAILSHFYLLKYVINSQDSSLYKLAQSNLWMIYAGVSLLIPGTILGGVWAAQSWGRFWDWDPKESWAFISGCLYLILIHAFRFKKISFFGLAVGSIIGLQSIIFTWYGVNYILGTGLHSYGFSTGGKLWYVIFLLTEVFFLCICLLIKKKVARNRKTVI